MGVGLGFLIGLLLGPVIFTRYIAPHIPKDKFLTVASNVTSTPTVIPTISVTEVSVDELTSQVIAYETEEEQEFIFTPTPSETSTTTPTKKATSTATKTPTNTPSQRPTSTPIPTVAATSSPTIIQVNHTPTPIYSQRLFSSQEINGYIDRFSIQYNVDPNVLRYITICESNFNNLAKSRNGLYGGLYQFSAGTWDSYRRKMGESADPNLRFNAEESVQTAAYVMSLGKSSIWPNCLP